MTNRPRALLLGGVALLVLAGILHVALRLTFGERAAYVNVRWAPTVDDAARATIERERGLVPVEFREQRTWGYFLTDLSAENIRAIVRHPGVEDTHHIDRARFRVQRTAERGDYVNGGPAWIARMLEFFRRVALLLGAAALVVGGYRTWRDRPARPTASPAA